MRHGDKKTQKFVSGHDANRALIKKLVTNFFEHNGIVTTLAKAKAIKPLIEVMVSKMKVKNEANRRFLTQRLLNTDLVESGFKNIGPELSKVNGGYVKIVRVGYRPNDGTELAKVMWAYPIVKEIAPVKPIKTDKTIKPVEQSKDKEKVNKK